MRAGSRSLASSLGSVARSKPSRTLLLEKSACITIIGRGRSGGLVGIRRGRCLVSAGTTGWHIAQDQCAERAETHE
jgi:hypothetical protein